MDMDKISFKMVVGYTDMKTMNHVTLITPHLGVGVIHHQLVSICRSSTSYQNVKCLVLPFYITNKN